MISEVIMFIDHLCMFCKVPINVLYPLFLLVCGFYFYRFYNFFTYFFQIVVSFSALL